MDFGVAAVVGERDRQNIGTPRYMAPEQMGGGEVSPQTDQYALALVVYEMLTGRLPWDVNLHDRKALAEAHRHAAPMPPSQFCPWLPARMDAPLLKALAKDPRARHETLHGLMFALRGLQWIGDRPGMTGDGNTTDPGALADGGVVRDEPDGAELAELSDSWEPPTWPRAEGAGRPARRAFVASALGGPTASESLTTVVRADVLEDDAPGAEAALDTPMTGASGPGRVRPIRSRGALARMALGLGGASAVVVLLVSARVARSPREPATSEVQVTDNQNSGAAPAASDLELGAQPPRSITDAVEVPRPPADSVAMPTPAPAEPEVKATSARPNAATSGVAARKATAPPRPALRSPPPKAPVPDDGRDELILPTVTR